MTPLVLPARRWCGAAAMWLADSAVRFQSTASSSEQPFAARSILTIEYRAHSKRLLPPTDAVAIDRAAQFASGIAVAAPTTTSWAKEVLEKIERPVAAAGIFIGSHGASGAGCCCVLLKLKLRVSNSKCDRKKRHEALRIGSRVPKIA